MSRSGEMNIDLPLAAKILELGIDKLWTIISDKNPRQSKMADDILPDKLNHIWIFDVGIRLGFHPLGEIISRHQNELCLPQSLRNWQCQAPIGWKAMGLWSRLACWTGYGVKGQYTDTSYTLSNTSQNPSWLSSSKNPATLSIEHPTEWLPQKPSCISTITFRANFRPRQRKTFC